MDDVVEHCIVMNDGVTENSKSEFFSCSLSFFFFFFDSFKGKIWFCVHTFLKKVRICKVACNTYFVL